MTQGFLDRFDREDGEIGSNYLIPCGDVTIFDQSVLPVDLDEIVSGLSPILDGTTDGKTQVLYNASPMDGPDYVVRGVWSHDAGLLGERELDELLSLASSDPSFTLLVRMEKDPMLVDLGRDQEPLCYDQGYGLRITCPRDGSAPVMKLVKFLPPALPPGIARPASTEIDGAQVLASVTLQRTNLNLDPADTGTGNPLYRGYVQESRLRIRRSDERVILEAFHNDRNMNTPILTYEDFQDPLWGSAGLPGFEFLSAVLQEQSAANSPFLLAAIPSMRCHLFQTQTVKDFKRPVSVQPENFYTYDRVVDRVVLLVEKNGDAKYTATGAGATKRTAYLQFVVEAEAHIIREVGHFHWLFRERKVYLKDSRETYELPADLGLVRYIRPSWNSAPLGEIETWQFHQRLAGTQQTGGRPSVYTMGEESVDNRKTVKVWPIPTIEESGATADDHLIVGYFARQIYPNEPDVQIPLIPQEHIDVLSYLATAQALLLDTDDANAERFGKVAVAKLQQLKRDEYRKVSGRQTVMRSAADVHVPNVRSRIPLLRATQLETLLLS